MSKYKYFLDIRVIKNIHENGITNISIAARFLVRRHVCEYNVSYFVQCFSEVFLESAVVIRNWQRAFL